MPDYRERSSIPLPLRASKSSIWDYAERVAVALSLSPGAPLEPIVARLGGRIEYKTPFKIDGRIPESIIINSKSDFTIFLPSMTSPARDRFTIAHELGHYFLHYPGASQKFPGMPMIATRWVDESDKDQQRAEWEANWFAASFLMPKVLFTELHARLSFEELAARFSVSVPAAQTRAKSLSLS
jgi:hypothetical protein